MTADDEHGTVTVTVTRRRRMKEYQVFGLVMPPTILSSFDSVLSFGAVAAAVVEGVHCLVSATEQQ